MMSKDWARLLWLLDANSIWWYKKGAGGTLDLEALLDVPSILVKRSRRMFLDWLGDRLSTGTR